MATTARRSGKGRWPLRCAVILALGGLGWGWFRLKPSAVGEAVAAYGRGDWVAAAALAQKRLQNANDDPEALRILARALAFEPLSHARAAYARLGAAHLEAEDHYLVGLCWRGRTDPGGDRVLEIGPGRRSRSRRL